ncbi:hypothetical protein QFZ68_000426 [Streptomyces sp. V1I6]|nr:hypothetical protein [Streptomyces sp. V1I6]
MGADGLDSALRRGRHGHRRQGRSHGRCAGKGGRPGQPGQAGAQGPLRLAGERLARPADEAADPSGRTAGGDRLADSDGPGRRPLPRAAGGTGPGLHRFLHHRPAVPGGVLHPRGPRPGRHRDEPPRRQHPPVHLHRRGGPQGVLRLRRTTGQLRRHRPRRRDRPVRAQPRRDPAGAVDARPGPAGGGRPAAARLRRSAAHPGGTPRHGASGAARRHQRGAPQRAAARDDPSRPGGPRVHRGAHGRLRGTRRPRQGLHRRVGGRRL